VRTLSKLEFNTPGTSWTRRCLKDAREFQQSAAPWPSFKISMSYRPGVPNSGGSDKRRRRVAAEVCLRTMWMPVFFTRGLRFSVQLVDIISAETTYSQTIETVRKSSLSRCRQYKTRYRLLQAQTTLANAIRKILEKQHGPHSWSLSTRGGRGSLTVFPVAEAFSRRRSAFQSLAEGSSLWRQATGKAYDDLLSAAEISDLLRFLSAATFACSL